MSFGQVDDGKHGVFKLIQGDLVAGEMAYTWAGDSMLIIDHTDVNERFRGQGVGRQLLDELIAFVRERQVKVIPLCPFAKSVFDKDASIHDVLKI
ncbi:GNAT family acetyltransferase [Acinetobacter sp. COS3]|uniref:GNAT family N-acetyltransferase n=1 Tax=Acinetobacter sp. COS3 TaxID=1397525 RepID=UPI0003B8B453|nr:GNAT family N-acetyltransferase [Acinetobacter sp. COS3]ERS02609.1 GNAT family acetyltransferase [Acinetobacter sp. COS3]